MGSRRVRVARLSGGLPGRELRAGDVRDGEPAVRLLLQQPGERPARRGERDRRRAQRPHGHLPPAPQRGQFQRQRQLPAGKERA